MEVLNKFYSSVTNTVSQLSGVLPGNPVTREYEVTNFISTAGPGSLWKIYRGYKKSTKQEVAIFVFEKKHLERWPRLNRDFMLETLKRGIIQLTKLRHPHILTIQHSLEESRESLAFATEPVFASLSNILGNMENMPVALAGHLKNFKLYDIEIKYGLMQVAEGLTFLHNDVKLLHHNICPESIIVNQQGAWKIFGFDFCIANKSPPGSPPFWPFDEFCEDSDPLTLPNLDYLAPEHVLSSSHSQASDIYSLGMLIYVIYSDGHQPLGNVQNNISTYKRFANTVRNMPPTKLMCIAEGLRDYVKLMLNCTPELRPDPHQFLKIPYFEDVGVKTLNYLDSLFQWDNLQKSQFYKGLPQVIHKMPHRISLYRIIPCLIKEFVNPPMVPFVLPNVLLIAENCSKEEFIKQILPALKPVMLIQDPIQILLIFMQKMELLLKLTPPEEVKSDILPMLYRALESDAQQIQELCLSVLPTFASLIDYPAMKNAILPRIKKLSLMTNYISVRVNALLCLGKLLEHLDKWLVLDEIIPFLPQIPSREPAVLMGILGILKLALGHQKLGITKEVLATKVLPFLIPLCVENGLTPNQFNALMSLVKQMLSKVETEHRAKLEQLNSIQNESKDIEHSLSQDNLVPTSSASSGSSNHIEQILSGLGVDSFSFHEKTKNDRAMPAFPSVAAANVTALTLEDKQRIAKQQETVRKLSQQAPLYSTPAPVKSHSNSIDLTDTLLQNNLTQLSTRNHQKSKLETKTYTALHQNQSPRPQSFNSNMYLHRAQHPQINSWMSTSASFPVANSNNLSNNANLKQDWSAFESLLPEQSQDSGNNNSKKSSHNEMVDLLM